MSAFRINIGVKFKLNAQELEINFARKRDWCSQSRFGKNPFVTKGGLYAKNKHDYLFSVYFSVDPTDLKSSFASP